MFQFLGDIESGDYIYSIDVFYRDIACIYSDPCWKNRELAATEQNNGSFLRFIFTWKAKTEWRVTSHLMINL